MDTGLGRPLAESVAGAGADAGSEGALEVEQRRHVVLLLLRQGRRRGRDGGGGEEDVESEEDGGGGGAAEEGHLLGKAVADEDPDPDPGPPRSAKRDGSGGGGELCLGQSVANWRPSDSASPPTDLSRRLVLVRAVGPTLVGGM